MTDSTQDLCKEKTRVHIAEIEVFFLHLSEDGEDFRAQTEARLSDGQAGSREVSKE